MKYEVVWEVIELMEVEADSPEEAEKKAKQGQYIRKDFGDIHDVEVIEVEE